MPEAVEQEYRRAQRASKIGAGCMYALAALTLIPLILFCATGATSIDFFGGDARAFITILIGLLATSGSVSLLGSFLQHFGHCPSPFGKKQSLRILLSGVLLGLRTITDSLCDIPSRHFVISSDATLFISSQLGPDLKVIVMIVFLICLAMVVRYGDALKEDSDSIA